VYVTRSHESVSTRNGETMTSAQDPNCIFCRIAAGEIKAHIVAETPTSIAFRDLAPRAPTHVLVIPRRHLSALRDVGPEDADLIADLLSLARTVAEQEGVIQGGYRVLTNDGPDAGQTVFHLHFHVLGGKKITAPLA
jgi:histidine triad (HIT) family protein